ncbi:MAG: hypothetical protein JXE07_03365 [Candidatus Aminicenantes bacterium]|nr:hypothetical protein [Candidatus Aminicenantes bacterium]
MKSISVHGIDDETEKKIGERAKSEGKSVNRVVKELIAKALGLAEGPHDNREAFVDLCGIWTEEEAAEFLRAVTDLGTLDAKDWR